MTALADLVIMVVELGELAKAKNPDQAPRGSEGYPRVGSSRTTPEGKKMATECSKRSRRPKAYYYVWLKTPRRTGLLEGCSRV